MGPPRYFTFLYGHKRNITKREGEKRTSEQYGLISAPNARKGDCVTILCSFSFICRLSWECIFRETSTSYKECQLIFDCLSSLPPSADRPSPGLLSHANWSLLLCVVDCFSPSFFVNWPLSSLGPSFPPPLPVSSEISSSSPLFGFRTKTDQEIVCLAYHPHSVTLLAVCCESFGPVI